MAQHTTSSSAERLGSDWSLHALVGFSSVAIGLFVLANPDPSVRLLGICLGINLLLGAGVLIVRGAQSLAPDGAGQVELLLGILALIAGAIVIRNPTESIALVSITLAIYLIVAGALALSRGLISPDRRAANLGKGLVLAIAGTVILSWPDLTASTFAVLAGIALCLSGAADIGEAFVLRTRSRSRA